MGWIKVKDRLPEFDVSVLLGKVREDGSLVYFVGYLWHIEKDGPVFYMPGKLMGGPLRDMDYWMAIPGMKEE